MMCFGVGKTRSKKVIEVTSINMKVIAKFVYVYVHILCPIFSISS